MKTKTCLVCAEPFDVQTPAVGTPVHAKPEPGSVLLCGHCGTLYRLGTDGEPYGVDLKDLEPMDPTQRAELELAQKRLRRRAQMEPPKGYLDAIVRTERAAASWLERNRRREAPRFRLPSPDILLAAALRPLVPRIGGNQTARELLAHLVRLEPGLTVFMVRVVAARQEAIAVETVGLSDLGIDVGRS
jgi:hypothetical protein